MTKRFRKNSFANNMQQSIDTETQTVGVTLFQS